ncbi:DUF808 domain-containing protein [Desulfosediminicola ganghwensis]|uniref:DUF808 domain-containing protein n=1 Tax=Desulfosediminicola ganghwensis TaxID=2569540 RepID=UPI0010ABED33|nr:DUF808 domain-containing protein [Desulfosediminicola ganghwensis]
MTGGIFAILDDIALLLDDAAVMSKVAAKKTAGILGDDLAVNAEKATGFKASRELPVIWAITRGSIINKLVILPLAFLLSAYASWLIVPILLLGGIYLSYEGMEKVYHYIFHRQDESHKPAAEQVEDKAKLLEIEKAKISSAVRTDFILSIEIIMIALGTVMDQSIVLQIFVVSFIALLATVGVYGIVALLVRMDDVGFYLIKRAAAMKGMLKKMISSTGSLLVVSLPRIIRALAVIGTVAMLLVGGGMFTHNVELIHHYLQAVPGFFANLVIGVLVGSVALVIQLGVGKIRKRVRKTN